MEEGLTKVQRIETPGQGAYGALRAKVTDALAADQPRVALGLLQSVEGLCAADADYVFDRARAHWALDDAAVAVRLMTLAVEASPDDAERWGRLGSMYLSIGERDAATTALGQAARLAPGSAAILAALNRADPVARDSRVARLLKRIAKSRSAARQDRATAENALGRIEEAAGRYAPAFRHYLKAKSHVAGRYDPGAMARHVAAQEAIFRPPGELPPLEGRRVVFVVGMPRSGTTLMEAILDRHPDVAGIGESRALPEALALCRKAHLGAGATSGWDWLPDLADEDRARLGRAYLARATERFPGAPPPVIVDKLPLNALEIGFAAHILPGARFIHMSRHPLDVGLSNIASNYRDGNAFSKRMPWIAHLTAMVARSALDYQAKLGPAFRLQSYRALVEAPEAGGRVVRTASITQVHSAINRKGLGKWRRFEAELGPLIAGLGGMEAIGAWETADREGRLLRFPAAEDAQALSQAP